MSNRFHSIINILGLAVAMGVCIIIYQYIYFEQSFDQFHKNADNIFRITQVEFLNGTKTGASIYTPLALGQTCKDKFPEVNDFTRIRPVYTGLIVSNEKRDQIHQEDRIWHVDRNFLNTFNFPLKYGDATSALGENAHVVLTEQMSEKYFGDQNPIGKTIVVNGGIYGGTFIVSGVLEALPKNSHLQFDFLFPLSFIFENTQYYNENNGWDSFDFITYAKFQNGVNLNYIKRKFNELMKQYTNPDSGSEMDTYAINFQSITDVHLHSDSITDEIVTNPGSSQNINMFILIGVFILIMAWVNYINLSTSGAIDRAKEVGIRKSIGALRRQLIAQFMLESFLINIFSGAIAILLAYLGLPILNQVITPVLSLSLLQQREFWLWLILIILVGSMTSGLHPALVLSSYKPINILKGKIIIKHQQIDLRKSLIVAQFFISMILIAGTYLIYKQFIFMKNQDLGIEMEKILVVNGPRVVLESLSKEQTTLESKYQAFKAKATDHHSISSVSASFTVPGKGYFFPSLTIRTLGDSSNFGITGSITIVDSDFIETYDMEVLAKSNDKSNYSPQSQVIINEKALHKLGFNTPELAINESLICADNTFKIVAVIKNVHWNSLKEDYSPTLYMLDNEYGAYFSVRMNLSNPQETIEKVETAFHETFPDDPFNYFFLDDAFNHQYQSDLQFGQLFTAFSVFTIFITCLGLFALVSHSARTRIKELGVRKILGAGTSQLVYLLSKEFLILLFIAFLIGFPVILWGGRWWLENYAFRIEMGIDWILIPAFILLIVGFFTVGYRTFLTASINPVDSLRSE